MMKIYMNRIHIFFFEYLKIKADLPYNIGKFLETEMLAHNTLQSGYRSPVICTNPIKMNHFFEEI